MWLSSKYSLHMTCTTVEGDGSIGSSRVSPNVQSMPAVIDPEEIEDEELEETRSVS